MSLESAYLLFSLSFPCSLSQVNKSKKNKEKQSKEKKKTTMETGSKESTATFQKTSDSDGYITELVRRGKSNQIQGIL